MKLTIITPEQVEYQHTLPPWFEVELRDLLDGKLAELTVQEEPPAFRRGWAVQFRFSS